MSDEFAEFDYQATFLLDVVAAARTTREVRQAVRAAKRRGYLMVAGDTDTYRVTLRRGKPFACSCPDATFRGSYCKHQRRAATVLRGGR